MRVIDEQKNIRLFHHQNMDMISMDGYSKVIFTETYHDDKRKGITFQMQATCTSDQFVDCLNAYTEYVFQEQLIYQIYIQSALNYQIDRQIKKAGYVKVSNEGTIYWCNNPHIKELPKTKIK